MYNIVIIGLYQSCGVCSETRFFFFFFDEEREIEILSYQSTMDFTKDVMGICLLCKSNSTRSFRKLYQESSHLPTTDFCSGHSKGFFLCKYRLFIGP